MIVRQYRQKNPGVGVMRPDKAPRSTTRCMTVYFPPDMADYLHQRAVQEHTSFGEQVRCLVEWGMDAIGETGV